MIRTVILIALIANSASAADHSQAVYASPDRLYRAVVTSIGPRGDESRIDVFSGTRRLRFKRSFASADGEHGFAVVRAQWTPDGKYIVVSMESSGGHQPWHRPTFVYSVRSSRFYSLDAYVGAVTSDFRLLSGGRIAISRLTVGDEQDEPVTFELSQLDRVRHSSRPN